MPFASCRHPSLQAGILKSVAAAHGIPTTTFHLSIDFAMQIGPEVYDKLSYIRFHLTGEWLFSEAAFGTAAPDRNYEFLTLLEASPDGTLACVGVTPDVLRTIRQHAVPAFLDSVIDTIDWSRYTVVGFSTTFQQNVPSIALARRLKERYPDIYIVFGGSNCDDPMGMELLRAVPCIDCIVIGEGERTLPELIDAVSRGEPVERVAGVACRTAGGIVRAPDREPIQSLDLVPPPDFDEYFERAERLGLFPASERHTIALPFESARGCWWGEKVQCTFCGLNGGHIAFRAKSGDRVRDELTALAARHGTFRFDSVDNILNTEYFETLLAPVTTECADYDFFYEVKSNLSRDQIKALSVAGVRRVQPGIESLSTPILRSMGKGVTGIQNVNFLRWARYYGVDAAWNFLWGFPDEQEAWYAQQAALIPSLLHLQAPQAYGRIWLERFSPLFLGADRYRRRWTRPPPSYPLVYPSDVKLDDLAYFFDYELEGRLEAAAFDEVRQ